jgi:hypothetical protein
VRRDTSRPTLLGYARGQFNWGDNTPDTTGCDGSHTYDVAGSKTVTVPGVDVNSFGN